MSAETQSRVNAPSKSYNAWLAIRALRLHHWSKNALLFVPAIVACHVNLSILWHVSIGFFAFSCMASAHYLLNDMLDRNHDRQHVAKWRRPQATGQMLPRVALGQATALVTVAVICATSLPMNFRLTLAAYLFVCVAYSIFLKRLLLMDILTLTILFDLRLVAGASAAVISLPGALLLACSPFFLTLAMFKRITQLSALSPPLDRLPGRPYDRGNLTTLRILAGMGSAASVVALAIFLSDTGTKVTRPGILWFALLLQTIWLGRCFVLAIRGVLNEDIVFFVITDLYSYVVLFALTLILIAAG